MQSGFILLATVLIASPACAQLTQIGAAGAVRGKVEALAPVRDAVGRVISSGKTVYLRDKITTGPQGRLQILLLDETVFTIGPDSALVLDEFVYDPRTESGKVSARITNGVFKFVTGKVARDKPSNMKIKLPVGTIGIRGTGGMGRAGADKSEVILTSPGPRNNAGEKPGALDLTNAGQTQDVTRAGYMTTAERGQPPLPAFPAPPDILAAFGSLFGSDPGDSAGSGGAAPGGADQGSASNQSGQDTVDSLGDVSNTDSINQVTEDNDNLTTNANQDIQGGGIADGTALWNDIRSRTSGSTYYDGFAGSNYTCTNGCAGSGQISFMMDIDFANRTIGGGGSSITLLGGPLNLLNTGLSQFSYDSLTGNAQWLLNAGNSSASSFYNTQITLKNSGGVAGQSADVGLIYDNGSGNTATGSVTGTLQ